MKTNKYLSVIVLGLMVICLTSCGNYYRMTSRIHSDGSMYREVFALGDSAFMAGNRKHTPFFFSIDSGWKLTRLDSTISFSFWGEPGNLNAKVSRTLTQVGAPCFETLPEKEYMKPLVVPHESLEKHFRWFYTYYTYRAVYEELPDKGPVPLDRYMTKEEQQIWFQGDKQACAGLNGMELKSRLDDIQSSFWQWYNRTQFELCCATIHEFASLQNEKELLITTLDSCKETVYKKYFTDKDSEMEDISLEAVCKHFDEQEKTTFFTKLYQTNKAKMKSSLEERGKIIQLFDYTIWFEVSMPGKLLAVDESGIQQQDDAIVWKVNAFRLLSEEYVLRAESRTVNYWTFAVTILLIILVGVGCWKLSSK